MLYRPVGWIGWVIATKTWSKVAAHVEVAVKPGISIAARSEGVNYYDTRWYKLSRVMRPKPAMDIPAGLAWFNDVARGQRYDTLGLLRFFLIGEQSTEKMFCSELATRFYRMCGFNVFPNEDADLIAPRTFLLSESFETIWADDVAV